MKAATMLPLALGLAAKLLTSPVNVPSAFATEAAAPVAVTAVESLPRVGLAAPASEVDETWEKPAPNKSRLGTCGWAGSTGADAVTNQRKNRTDMPARYHAVDFNAIMDLPWPHEATTRRDRWTSEQLAEIAPYEGVALTVTGFVVALRPQARNSEATNCGETGEERTDWHIALVGEFGDKEPEAMVVETTPRIKRQHPDWVPGSLRPFVGTADSVRVSGYLLFDPVHKGHLGKYRKTLWEIHPIHRIEVWQGGRWRELE